MFFLLSVKENQGRFRDKLRDAFYPPQVSAEKLTVPGALPFYKITAVRYRGRIPWMAIAECADGLCDKAVIPNGIKTDETCGIKKYEPKVLPLRVLFCSAVAVIKKLGIEPFGVSVCVFDENACLTGLIEELVYLAGRLRIITHCTEEYGRLAKKLLEKYGVSVMISEKADESILSSTVIIADDAKDVPLLFGGILFANKKRRMLGATVLSGSRVTLPQKYKCFCDDGIDPLLLASALYELCAAQELSSLVYDDIAI